jgi:hypothetical protein
MFTAAVPDINSLPEYNQLTTTFISKANMLKLVKYDKDITKLIHDLNEVINQSQSIQFIPKFPFTLSHGIDQLCWSFHVADEKRQKRTFYGILGTKELEYYKIETKCKYLSYNMYNMIELPCAQYTFGVVYADQMKIPHRSIFFKMFNEIKSVTPIMCDILMPRINANISYDVTKFIGRMADEKTNFYLHHQFMLTSANDFTLNTDDTNSEESFNSDLAKEIELNQPFMWYTRRDNMILSMGIFD